MLQLRIRQHAEAENRHRVEIDLTGDGAPRAATSTFEFHLSPQDEEDLRWYLEDFLQYPQEPSPTIARRIEGLMSELGTKLFADVFQSNDDARDVWSRVRERLPQTRIEIVTGVTEAATIPWELLREPKTTAALALSAHSFVRAQPNTALAPQLPARKKRKIRILLVLCRPRGGRDVPFRSVASRLIKGLSEANRETYDLDVLRPPTFEQLGKTLRQAHGEDRPYHVVHFDGHGMYQEVKEKEGFNTLLRRLSPLVLAGDRTGKHGYLWFENPQLKDNGELVDGTSLGQLLAATGVSVLVLNACRSAHTEPATAPLAESGTDPHSQVRAFGSLAQEVLDAGVAGVVAMLYNLYVVTAAQFVAELYASLVRGAALGEAVTLARKNLSDNPLREVVFAPLTLQDWTVPVVYESAPLQLFQKVKGDSNLKIHVEAGATASATGGVDAELPPPPDAGFYGRDETLLALDRAFDRTSIVLLHAYAGSGKTTTAAEFARWYSLTDGVHGPVLFTTFEHYLPLPRVLDRIGQVFGAALERSGAHWLALDDSMRRQVALQVLAQGPVLWIWDNVEPVAGFPAGTESAWSAEEQQELLSFLRALRETKAKVLLTSRRAEQSWLGNLPTRITVPPMPMTESLQVVRALADKHGRRLADVEDWRPLLTFAQGNPLTLTVLAGQALRQGWKTKEQIEAFVARLRSGEAAFPDESSEGRSRSLGASLAYGFEQAFRDEERKKLALLHLFQGAVDVDVLRWMGEPDAPWCLPEVRGLTREEGIALLDRAAEVGLLAAHGDGYYGIGKEEDWSLVTEYRVRLAHEERQWTEAERLQTVCIDWDRQRATPALARPAGELESKERNAIRTLAVALEALGTIRRELERAECVPAYEEALDLSDRIGDRAEASICAFNLGHAFMELIALRDLEQAERWYRRSLELRDERDRLGRGRCVAQLGHVALKRFREARTAGQSQEELLLHLNAAARRYHEALDLLPADAVNELAVAHHQLGAIYDDAGDLDRAVQYYRESIYYEDMQGNQYGAAETRFNVAAALINVGRRADALEYAEAAMRVFESYGERAAEAIERTRGLIAKIGGQ